jgi:hypothetical protein
MTKSQELSNDNEIKTLTMQQICLNNATHFTHINHRTQKVMMECDV